MEIGFLIVDQSGPSLMEEGMPPRARMDSDNLGSEKACSLLAGASCVDTDGCSSQVVTSDISSSDDSSVHKQMEEGEEVIFAQHGAVADCNADGYGGERCTDPDEEEDKEAHVLSASWVDVWKQLSMSSHDKSDAAVASALEEEDEEEEEEEEQVRDHQLATSVFASPTLETSAGPQEASAAPQGLSSQTKMQGLQIEGLLQQHAELTALTRGYLKLMRWVTLAMVLASVVSLFLGFAAAALPRTRAALSQCLQSRDSLLSDLDHVQAELWEADRSATLMAQQLAQRDGFVGQLAQSISSMNVVNPELQQPAAEESSSMDSEHHKQLAGELNVLVERWRAMHDESKQQVGEMSHEMMRKDAEIRTLMVQLDDIAVQLPSGGPRPEVVLSLGLHGLTAWAMRGGLWGRRAAA